MMLRRLLQTDSAAAAALAARAFESERVGAQVQSMLETYFVRGLDRALMSDQANEAMPREYFAYIDEREPLRLLGITGLYRFGTWTWPGNLWLGWTAIDREAQGQGLGTRMLEEVVQMARDRGAECLKVETEAGGRATAFYLRNGFVEEARLKRHYGHDLDAVILARGLLDVDRARDDH